MSSSAIPGRRRQGLLFVVSAPSGTGKTSLCQELVATIPDVRYSISYTTRPRRATEVAAKHYHFVDQKTFRAMIEADEFLEWAEVYGHLYGTPRVPLRQWRQEGIDVLLDIDTQGAAQIRQREPSGVSIYLLPPSLAVLRRRLQNRQSDAPEEIARRLKKAKEEVKAYREYQYVVINDDFKSAYKELEAIVLAERNKTSALDLSSLEQALTGTEEES
jgi:guanylate kinase